jgi:hypothetical protein
MPPTPGRLICTPLRHGKAPDRPGPNRGSVQRRARNRVTLCYSHWSEPSAHSRLFCTLAAASVLGDGCAQMGTFCTRRALEGDVAEAVSRAKAAGRS